MSNGNEEKNHGGAMAHALKGWAMLIVTITFVGLYGAALTGWLRPLADVTMITRLEPIIFVIIGYYFGRLPAQANEKTLHEQIDRQTKRTDAAQFAKETSEKEREVMEEKIKNARIALVRVDGSSSANAEIRSTMPDGNGKSSGSVATAIRILES